MSSRDIVVARSSCSSSCSRQGSIPPRRCWPGDRTRNDSSKLGHLPVAFRAPVRKGTERTLGEYAESRASTQSRSIRWRRSFEQSERGHGRCGGSVGRAHRWNRARVGSHVRLAGRGDRRIQSHDHDGKRGKASVNVQLTRLDDAMAVVSNALIVASTRPARPFVR